MAPEKAELAPDAQAFVAWARSEAVSLSIPRRDEDFADLDFIGEVIGDARVVAFGESAHYLHEWNRFRARLFKYLAQQHGFTTFVLESGLVEGKNIHDYVDGADVEWDTVVASVTNGWGVWAELQELITWMRDYNADPGNDRRLRFYGTDGSGNWSHARHALEAVLDFLRTVDASLRDEVARDLESSVRQIGMDNRGQVDESTWHRLIAKSALLISHIERNEFAYIEASTPEAYDWGVRYAHVLRDLLLCFAQTDPDFTQGFRSFWNTRDVAMTQQLGWILEREGPAARIVVGAHNTHLQQHPVRDQKATSMGAYLANRIGRERILFIGAASARSVKGDEPRPDSNQAAYDRVGPECFFLDLRSAPDAGPVAHWLRTGRADRHNLRYQQIAPGRAWDCLLFNRTTSIAEVQLPPTMRRKLGPADPERFDDYVGDYVVHGFLAQPNALTVLREADALFADGSADLSGELFPPMKTRIQASDDGRFVWPNWPAVLEFHGAGRVDRVTITMPGMGVYSGHRVTPAEDA